MYVRALPSVALVLSLIQARYLAATTAIDRYRGATILGMFPVSNNSNECLH